VPDEGAGSQGVKGAPFLRISKKIKVYGLYKIEAVEKKIIEELL